MVLKRAAGALGWALVLLGAVRLMGGTVPGVLAGLLMASSGLVLTATGRRLLGVRREDALVLAAGLFLGAAAINVLTTP